MNDNSSYKTGSTSVVSATNSVCNNIYKKVATGYQKTTTFLSRGADQLPPLLLRIILAYEFWEAGIMKYEGENWFNDMAFPFPFSLLSGDTLWFMSISLEIIGSVALVLGIATRFFSLAFMVLTIVAIQVAHWPTDLRHWSDLWQGYAITDTGFGNFKLPLIFLTMFFPLLFGGAGKWSLDYAFKRTFH